MASNPHTTNDPEPGGAGLLGSELSTNELGSEAGGTDEFRPEPAEGTARQNFSTRRASHRRDARQRCAQSQRNAARPTSA
jgi:hypothetical protein